MVKFFKKAKQSLISEVVILAAIFGFAAGVVGQIFSDVYFTPWRQADVMDNLNRDQANLAVVPELRRTKRLVGGEQDFAVAEAVQRVELSLVGFYQKKISSSSLIRQIHLDQELLGNGFILTSDGWLVAAAAVISGTDLKNLVVVSGAQEYAINQAVTDPMTQVVFIKIAADNLPVVVLGDSQSNFSGQLLTSVNALGEVAVSHIKQVGYQGHHRAEDYILSTERYQKVILLADPLATNYVGAPLVNLAGEVVGIITAAQNQSLAAAAGPINQFRPVILNVLKSGLTKRPYLGLEYLDLANIPAGVAACIEQSRGALIYSAPQRNSPAADADLRLNDIILSVDNQPLDQDNNLTEVIQQYQPADQLTFEILRDNQRLTKQITLSLLPE